MIVRMKRLTLLCLASTREQALRRLQQIGVVHVTSLRPPDSRALETSRSHLAHIRRALEVMPQKSRQPPSGMPADLVANVVWTLLQNLKDIEDALAELRQERLRILPFGDFDPGMIRGLHRHGVFVRLYAIPPGVEVTAPEGTTVVEIAKDKSGSFLALVARGEATLPFPEFRLPDRPLKDIEEQIAEFELRYADCEASLNQHRGDHEPVAALRDRLEDTVHFLEARDGMGAAAPIAYLRGYLPADRTEPILEAARREGWGVRLEDPGPDEEVPTLIRNPGWVKPIKTVLKGINVIPGYREVDMSAVFLVFFSFFFAMLIGDAGYGLLFLVGTRLARRRFSSAPAEPFTLLTLTSLCTIAWGVLTGTYFGAAAIPAVLEHFRVPWLADPGNLMSLCFLVGALHLTVAHAWNAVRMAPSPVFLAQVGWIAMTWTMYFLAHFLVLNRDLPGGVGGLALAGGGLILLFMTPVDKLREEWYQHIMFPLNIVSNFVDVVSYLRLFAVGSASLAVAAAFNEMALAGGVSGLLSGALAAFILFAGHALNIVLGAMGILVHGVRLNTLEFSSHLGVQWTGHLYEPFAHKRDNLTKEQ